MRAGKTNAVRGLAAAVAIGAMLPKARARLALSRAKHPSLTGHARWSRRLARLTPYYAHRDDAFFACDQAPEAIARQRQAGFERLSALYAERFEKSVALTKQTREGLSDLQFTGAYRVPFQFSELVREKLAVGSFAQSAEGAMVTDLDGNRFYDLTGSYGVNLFGHDFYRSCMAEAARRTGAMAELLGVYHPVVADNVDRLRRISGLDEVSFHMSGTEAVMQAVRLACYHTRRKRLVRFCGAYHGWWGDVQPGVGNPVPADNTLTLSEMSERTLEVLRRRRDIACVLVNPIQALHPNRAASSDSMLVDSSRGAGFDRAAYTGWLQRLRAVCDEAGIVLIFDEVFSGFRFAPSGAKEYFGVQPDLITYGKSLGGGFPVGVLCGRAALMRRYRDDRPADICFARGTFNAHPQVMGAMAVFLDRIEQPEIKALYTDLDARWNDRAQVLNQRLTAAGLPVAVANLSSVWTVLYTVPSRYNWMLQYYLRAHGLMLSWVGTGRLIFNLAITDREFSEISDRFVAACDEMRQDGWWWSAPHASNKAIKRQVLGELLATVMRRPA